VESSIAVAERQTIGEHGTAVKVEWAIPLRGFRQIVAR